MQNPWAREYARTPERYIWGKAPSGLAREIADRLSPGSRVLDLGCGEGRDSVYFASRGFEVTGLDVSPEALAKGRRLAEEREVKVQWLCRSMLDAPVAGRFDLVYSCGSVHHLPRRDRAHLFRRLRLLTEPGGLHAHIVFTDRMIYREKGEEIDYFRQGELPVLLEGWTVLADEDAQISCAQDGVKHAHSVERLLAARPRN
jgi:tellurite methyltransferase